MGTLADKLNKVLDTKERIRQALISIGEDVPEDLPFSKYPDLINPSPIKGVKGIVGVYTAKGLTNDQMKANPVWEDQSKYKNHLQMKNFSWSLGSGCGSYVMDPNLWKANVPYVVLNKTASSISVTNEGGINGLVAYMGNKSWNVTKARKLKVTSSDFTTGEVNINYYVSAGGGEYVELKVNGITEIPANPNFTGTIYLSLPTNKSGSLTIEEIPDYSGAIVFDGVDDYGICDTFPILTKENGYTVMALRKWITEPASAVGLVSNVKNWFTDGAFILEYQNKPVSFGYTNSDKVRPSLVTYQTSTLYNDVQIGVGDFLGTNVLCVGSARSGAYYSNTAVYSVVVVDHDTTAEERQKVIDYWKQEFPELFFDQAWTVVGKTNNDSDKAVIKNLTGNGNNLNLYNFSFSKSSGYGSYKWNFKDWSAGNVVETERSSTKLEFKGSLSSGVWGYGLNKTVGEELPINVKVRVTGLNSNLPKLYFGKFDSLDENSNQEMVEGINVINRTVGADVNMIGFGFQEAVDSCDVVIEQIPDYEGYLVLDGVNDFASSQVESIVTSKFTLVGDWKFIIDETKSAGICIDRKAFIYNNIEGCQVYINDAYLYSRLKGIKSLKAICSDGRVYDENWNEITINVGDYGDIARMVIIGKNVNEQIYTQMIFGNLSIYNDVEMTRDQCINAYNYLQTFKN